MFAQKKRVKRFLTVSGSHLQAEAGREEMPVCEREREEREGRRERREEQGLVTKLQFKLQPDTDNLRGKWLHFVAPLFGILFLGLI